MIGNKKDTRLYYTPTGLCKQQGFGYSAANTSWEGRNYIGGSGDAHMAIDRIQLVHQERALRRENPIYKGLIERAINYIHGTGFKLDIRTKNKSYNTKLEKLWNNWVAGKPEVRELVTGSMVLRQVTSEILGAGDLAIVKLKSGHIQLIESEQIANFGVNYAEGTGLKFDESGRLTHLYICPYVNGSVDISRSKDFKCGEEVIFVTNPDRPSQSRTVPPMQSSFAMLHRINDMCDSEAIAAQLLSRLAMSITGEGMAQAGDNSSVEDIGGVRIEELDYASLFYGNEGTEIKAIERNIPGKNFENGLRMFMRILGLPLGLPLEIILLDWTKSNYSQSRAVLEQAYRTFVIYQNILVTCVYRPLFNWKKEQWQTEGLIEERNEENPDFWIVPAFPWIDQLKEAQACELKVASGFGTYTEMLKSRGLDAEETRQQLKEETIEAIKIAKDIEAQTGEKVDWRRFAGLKDSGAAAMVITPDEEEETSTKNKKKGEDDTDED